MAISFPNSLMVRSDWSEGSDAAQYPKDSTLLQVLSGGGSNLVDPMDTLVKADDRRVFKTQSLIDFKVRNFWLDHDCQWHSDLPDPGFAVQLKVDSWDAIEDVFDAEQLRRAIHFVDEFLSSELREIATVFNRSTGFVDETDLSWNEALRRLDSLFCGAFHLLHFQGRVDSIPEDHPKAALGEPHEFVLDRGSRLFFLDDGGWFELAGDSSAIPETRIRVRTELRNVIEFTDDRYPGQKESILSAHAELLRMYVSRLRDLVNKVRSGSNLLESEVSQLGVWCSRALELSCELGDF